MWRDNKKYNISVYCCVITNKLIKEMKRFTKYSEDTINKLGNTLIYLCNRIPQMSKTKALKLIYILDETSIKKSGIPFLNLRYCLWKYGPVDSELFVELSNDNLFLLKDYVKKENSVIVPLKDFIDDEFSDNDIELMDSIIDTFGSKSANELSHYTHRENSVWRNSAKENNILDELLNEEISSTDIVLDMSEVVKHDSWKTERYKQYLELN